MVTRICILKVLEFRVGERATETRGRDGERLDLAGEKLFRKLEIRTKQMQLGEDKVGPSAIKLRRSRIGRSNRRAEIVGEGQAWGSEDRKPTGQR